MTNDEIQAALLRLVDVVSDLNDRVAGIERGKMVRVAELEALLERVHAIAVDTLALAAKRKE